MMTITAINGDRGGVSASNMPQSINVKGDGFPPDVEIVVRCVNPHDRGNPLNPMIQVAAKGLPQGITFKDGTEFDALLNFPIDSNGPAQALVFSPSGGISSGWFSFPVK